MAYQKVQSLDCDKVLALGGIDKEGRPYPRSLEGYYLGSRTVDSETGKSTIHVFQTATGNLGLWGAADTNSKLSTVKKGTMTLVEFKEKKKIGGGKTKKIYEVSQDPDNTITVEASESVGEYTNDSDYSDDVNSDDGGDVLADTNSGQYGLAANQASRKAEVEGLLKGRKTK